MNRFVAEMRGAVDGDRLAGHAAVFGQLARMPGRHYEEIARTAFDRALKGDADVKCLFNHDPSRILGSTRSGTLRLSVDDVGLAFEVDLPDTTNGRDVRELVARGDLSGMSFGFLPGEHEWSLRSGARVRTHTAVEALLDVSPVSYPAYEGTDVALRAVDLGRGRRTASEQMIRLAAAHHLKGAK